MKYPESLESSDPSNLQSMQHMRVWKEGSCQTEPTSSVGVSFLIIGLCPSNCKTLKGTVCLPLETSLHVFVHAIAALFSYFTGVGSRGIQGAIVVLCWWGYGGREIRKKKRKEGKEEGRGRGRKKGDQGRKREKKRKKDKGAWGGEVVSSRSSKCPRWEAKNSYPAPSSDTNRQWEP